jgi:PhnB protein
MKLYTHLNFGGNCEEAFLFYEKHLGGKIIMIMKQSQLPSNYNVKPGPTDPVVHIRMDIAGVELMGNDVPEEYFKPVTSSYLYFSVDSTEEAERVFGLLADGGKIGMPMEETFFATRFGQVRDRFGVLWSIIHPKAMQ